VSQFLYQTIELALSNNGLVQYDKALLGKIDQQLMHLIDLMEDLLSSNSNELNEQVLEQIEILEAQFSQIFKHNAS
jgi:hypothetical protein